MRIVITGAAGNIGRLTTRELEVSHDLVLVDRRRSPGGTRADVSRHRFSDPWHPRAWLARWDRLFTGADAVVHLAGEPDPDTPWPGILRHNVKGTWNVLEAASRHHVPHFVFASSTWTVRAAEQALAPDCYRPDGPKLDSTAFPRPTKAYGLGKGFAEMAGRMFVDDGRLTSFTAVRFGYAAPRSRLAAADEWVERRWIGPTDTARLVRRCVEHGRPGFRVVYGISDQADSPFDSSGSRESIGWQPQESAHREGPADANAGGVRR